MNGLAYTRYELLRTFRNRRFYLFSLGFPLVLYWVIAAPQRNNHNIAGTGISFPLYYMVGLASFGIRAKVVTAYVMALLSLALLYASGAALGVSLSAQRWAAMTALILVGLLPFAAFGILIGHLVTTDSVGPIMGGLVSILAFVSGTWFPITSGFLYSFGPFLSSWWLVQASRTAINGHGWGARGWITVAAWAVVLALLAAWSYRRDTGRV